MDSARLEPYGAKVKSHCTGTGFHGTRTRVARQFARELHASSHASSTRVFLKFMLDKVDNTSIIRELFRVSFQRRVSMAQVQDFREISVGDTLAFRYHGKIRAGKVERVEVPRYFTIEHEPGEYKSYSLYKIDGNVDNPTDIQWVM